jgi:ATP-dependent helicase/DNAse subunit B
MSTLLTGAAGSGKTARILREFRAALPANRARILVPTATLATHLRNELARDGVVFHPSGIDTLAHFIQELRPNSRQVSDDIFHLAVESSVAQLGRPEFAEVAKLPGFSSRLARTLSDLDAAGCTPAALSRVDREKAPYRDALVAIWQLVIMQLHDRGFVTRAELLRELAADPGHALPIAIWFDGFAQISTPEFDFICALAKRTRVTVAIADEGASEWLKATLRGRGFVEEHLQGARVSPSVLVVPENEEREAAEIARRILEHNQAGVAFRDIGVILRKPENYAPVLRATFERFGIPAHFYFRRPLDKHPAGRLLIGAIDALLSGWDHQDVLELLRFIPFTGTSSVLDAFELEVRAKLPGRGLQKLLELAGKRRTLIRPLKHFAELETWLNLRLAPAEWAARLAQMPALFAPRLIPDNVSPAAAAEFRSFAVGMNAFVKAVASAAQWWVAAAPTIMLAAFWRTAALAIRDAVFDDEPRARNSLHVVSAFEARQWNLELVFIPGLIEKQFPAQNDRDPFLPDPAMRELARQGFEIRTASQKDDEEQVLFDVARTRARREVVFSYPHSDARGQRVLPSIFLKDSVPPQSFPAVVQPATPPPVMPWRVPSRIADAALLAALAQRPERISVSSLETLLECPFKFLTERALKLVTMPPAPEDRADFLFQGNVAHEALSAWWASSEPMANVFARAFVDRCGKDNVQPGFRTERARRTVLTSLLRFEADTQYPRAFRSDVEQKFEVSVEPGLTITGRFDRIDYLDDGRAVVIDYKFSPDASTKEKIDDDTRLQGPLYAYALREKLGLEAETVLYISLKGPKISYFGWGTPPPEADLKPLAAMTPDWISGAVARTRDAVASFRSGVIHPLPADPAKCYRCNVRDACRFEVAEEALSIGLALSLSRSVE